MDNPTVFGSSTEHMNSRTNDEFTNSLSNFFQTQGAGTRFENQFIVGKGTVECQTHKIQDIRCGEAIAKEHDQTKDQNVVELPNKDNDTTAEAAVWLIRDPISGSLQDEIMREVNQIPFLASSQEVGANTKKNHDTTECLRFARRVVYSNCCQIHVSSSVKG